MKRQWFAAAVLFAISFSACTQESAKPLTNEESDKFLRSLQVLQDAITDTEGTVAACNKFYPEYKAANDAHLVEWREANKDDIALITKRAAEYEAFFYTDGSDAQKMYRKERKRQHDIIFANPEREISEQSDANREYCSDWATNPDRNQYNGIRDILEDDLKVVEAGWGKGDSRKP